VDTDIKYISRFTNLHTLSLENFYHHLPERPLMPVYDAKALGGIKAKYTNPDFKVCKRFLFLFVCLFSCLF
jgi:hypothetical protein